jgi:hypothetical protein
MMPGATGLGRGEVKTSLGPIRLGRGRGPIGAQKVILIDR